MVKINIRPLSSNRCWQGRRFKTDDYKVYEQELFYILPKKLKIPSGNLHLKLIFGFSNKASDIDNGVKPFIDVLQKYYGFNDKDIYKLEIEKTIVPKASEYIDFVITSC